MLVSRQVLLLSVLLGSAMGMSGDVVQFGGSLVVLVMRSVVISSGHNLESPYLPRLGVRFLGQFVSVIRVLKCSFGMPPSRLIIPFFVMFGGSTVGARRQLVPLGGLPVCLVHGCFLLMVSVLDSSRLCTRRTNFFGIGMSRRDNLASRNLPVRCAKIRESAGGTLTKFDHMTLHGQSLT